MIFIKINEQLYPASINSVMNDKSWNGRYSKSITIQMTYETANKLFVDDADWAIVYQAPEYQDEFGETIVPAPVIYEQSDFSIAGPITDNRDGTITVKMGKLTAEEMLAILQEVM